MRWIGKFLTVIMQIWNLSTKIIQILEQSGLTGYRRRTDRIG
jgi:hypothetical protein